MPAAPGGGGLATSGTKRRWIAVMLLAATSLAFSPSGRAAQATLTVDAVLKQLDRGAKMFESLTADVERTKVTVVVDDRSTESGQMQVRHDDKMRIELTSPDPRTILRDGDHLFIYTPKTRQVEEYDLGKHRDLVDQFLLLGFGTSADNLKKGYLITVQGEENIGAQKVVRLELTPKSGDVRKQISKIELWLDEATWLPAQQKFYETGTEDYFIIRYTNVARNVSLPDSRFKPHWPGGVTRVKPQG
jgi:outer membrane lipoprotein-sorting protein